MTIVDLTIAVADATKGTNLLAKSGYHKSSFNRKIRAIGFTGSAAADDAELIIKYGSADMGRVRNRKTGLVIVHSDDMLIHSSGLVCKPEEDLSVEVSVAPTTNPIKLIVDIAEVK